MSPVTTDPEGNANLFPSTQLPIWLKIERRGNDFTTYASADGAFWIPVGRKQHIPLNAPIAAGVFVSATRMASCRRPRSTVTRRT